MDTPLKLKPQDILEPSENGSKNVIRCPEQIEASLRYLGIEKDPKGIECLIVLLDDDAEIVSVWCLMENEWLATQIMQRTRVTL